MSAADPAHDPELDEIVQHAALACDVPAVAIAVDESGRITLKARVGVQQAELPGASLPAMARDLLVIDDLARSPAPLHHPLLQLWPGARLFALAPILDRRGGALGALVALDRRARPLLVLQREALRFCAGHAASLLLLRRKLRSFVRLVEALPERLYAFDKGRRCMYASIAGARAHGLSPAQMIGCSLADLATTDYAAARLQPLVERVFETGRPTTHREVLPTDSGMRSLELHLSLLRSPQGEVEGVVVQAREEAV